MENEDIVSIYPWFYIKNNKMILMLCKPNKNEDKMINFSTNLIEQQIEKKGLIEFLNEILQYIRNGYICASSCNNDVILLEQTINYIFIIDSKNNIILEKAYTNTNNDSHMRLSEISKNSPKNCCYFNFQNKEVNIL